MSTGVNSNTMRTLVFVASGALALSSCKLFEPPPAPTYESTVKVEGDPGQPIAGAKITYKGEKVGTTNNEGRLKLRLKGAEGEVFDLMVACPQGYQSPTKPLPVTLRKVAEQGAMPEYKVSCPPTTRTVVVAVRAENGPNLPVRDLGREVARTDQSGAAHVKLSVSPNQALQLSLDTTEEKNLRPQSPTQQFEVKNADEVFVFDQTFKVERRYHYAPRRTSSGPTPL